MEQLNKNYIYIIFLVLLASCASKKDLIYFQGATKIENSNSNYQPKLKADDRLSIIVSAIDNAAAIPFNLPVAGVNTNGLTAVGNQQLQTYLIAKDGTIDFPQLGTLHLAGLTRMEATNLIKTKIGNKLKGAVVNVRLLNFKITVLGEVAKPGIYQVPSERITVIEALGLASDLTIHGTRKNVLVIRETENGKTTKSIDLTSSDVFNSSVYYLQQNDVVYVEPNKPKINSSANSSTTGVLISATSLLITIVTLIRN